MSALERKPEALDSAPDKDLGPGTDWRGIARGPLQLAWRLDFPEATRAGPRTPRYNLRGIPIFLLQLEKKQEFFPSRQDEALFSYSVSREIPPSLLSLERVLDALDATQEVPQQTPVHSRGTGSVLPQLKKLPIFPSSSQDEGPYPCFVGKAIMAFPSHLKRRRTQLEVERNSRVRATIPKEPDVPIHFRYT